MDDYFPIKGENLKKILSGLKRGVPGGRFKGTRAKKIYTIIFINLAFIARLFFSVLFEQNVYAKEISMGAKTQKEVIDPLAKIGKEKIRLEKVGSKNVCLDKKTEIRREEDKKEEKSEKIERIRKIVSGRPMEQMVFKISEKDDKIGAFLIGIAKKESDWGVHAPHKNGQDCYNYWGFKGGYKPVAGGYSCFDTPEQAVDAVSAKLEQLVAKKIDTPERMLVWKCGSSCAGHDPKGVSSWVGTVRTYFDRLNS